MGRIEDILGDAVARIRSVCDPQKIILFGSQSAGVPTGDSDIDLMVILPTDELPHRRSLPIRKALRGISLPKDIIVKTPAAHFGTILYERP
jgi:predicted nucleotidyltransferase